MVKKIIDECIFLWLLMVVYIFYFLSIDQQTVNEGWFCLQIWLFLSCFLQCCCRQKFGIWDLYNSLTDLKIVREMTRDDWFKNCDKNNDEWHIRNIQTKYKIIIIIQYTIEEYVAF